MYKPLKIKRKSRVEGNMDSLVNKVRAMAKEKIIKKHNSTSETLDIKVINDIIYNEKAHIVSVFKDYLIYDDNSEFMKRYLDLFMLDFIKQLKQDQDFQKYLNIMKLIQKYSQITLIWKKANIFTKIFKRSKK